MNTIHAIAVYLSLVGILVAGWALHHRLQYLEDNPVLCSEPSLEYTPDRWGIIEEGARYDI